MSGDDVWRLRQQAELVARLAADGGFDTGDANGKLAALGSLVDTHASLVDDARRVGDEIDHGRASLIDTLDELAREHDSIERSLREAYRVAAEVMAVERGSSGERAELLSSLQSLTDP